MKEVQPYDSAGTNRLIKACVIFVGRKVGLKPKKPDAKKQQSIQLGKHIHILERRKREELKRNKNTT